MSHPILQKVQTFLEQAGHRSVKVSDDLIEEFGEVCKRTRGQIQITNE
jgi:hypothetical protein